MPTPELRIFVSSPGDVAREREIARRIIDRLQGEFAAQIRLAPYFWEHEPMLSNAGDYQENIPAPAEFEVFLCLLWSRLGTRLHPKQRTREGQTYKSGTEYEFKNALEAARASVDAQHPRGRPEMLVFIKKAPLVIEPEPKTVRDERYRQFDDLQEFICYAFRDQADGTFAIAANTFTDLAAFEELLEKGLRRCILDRLPQSALAEALPPASYTAGPPFLGLRAFDKEHAPVFFGRTAAIDAVLTQLRQAALSGSAFCLIFGGSGVGKSSLARAGVLPMLLRPGVIEGVGLWRSAIFQPRDGAGENPDLFLALARAVLSADALPELRSPQTTPEWLAHELREHPRGIRLLLQTGLDRVAAQAQEEFELEQPPAMRFALLVDQMEELFTIDWIDAQTRERFIAALAALARSGLVYVIGTLRSDFFSRCEELPELMALKAGPGAFHLQPPTRTEIAQMIRQPALAGGLRFERDPLTDQTLDEALLHDAAERPDALPLLAFALEELYQRRDAKRQLLRFADYNAMGGIAGAITSHAESTYAKWRAQIASSAEAERAFDMVLRRLVDERSLRDASAGFARVPADKAACETTPAARAFVESFLAARLFLTDTPASGKPFLILAHDALLRLWPRLTSWLEKNRTFFRWRARAEDDRRRWEAENRNPSLLIQRGIALEQAKQLRKEHGVVLDPPLADFIALSIAAEERELAAQRAAEEEKRRTLEEKLAAEQRARSAEQRRLFIQRIAGAILALLLLVAIAAGWLARRNEQRALKARAEADELNTYLLGDLRERLEETGRLDLLESAAQQAEAYLRRLANEPPGDARRTQELLLVHNIARLRLAQGRLGDAREVLRLTNIGSISFENQAPETIEAAARVLNATCDLLARTGENAEGQRAGRKALDLLKLLPTGGPAELRADILINIADLQRQANQHRAAAASIGEAVQLLEPKAKGPDAQRLRRTLLRALLREGDLATTRGDLNAAQRAFERRLLLTQEFRANEPLAPLWQMEEALAHDRLAQFWLLRGDARQATAAAEMALGLWKELLAIEPNNLEWLRLQATSLTKRGQAALASGRAEEARTAFEKAVEIGAKLTATAPGNLNWQGGLATAHSLLADALSDLDDAGGALREANLALEIRRRIEADPSGQIDADNRRNLVRALIKTAVALMNEGRYPEGEKLASEALARAGELAAKAGELPEHRRLLADAFETLAETLVGQERQVEAAQLYVEARGARERIQQEAANDPGAQIALAECRMALGGLYKDGTHTRPAAPDFSAARAEFAAARDLLQAAAAEFPQDARVREKLAEAQTALASLDSAANNPD
ncbi:MAG TPA: AAA family ATPase [Chthoniobacterales bacterium]|nr:AAA family ATPase [Chthoniobacterales bacterium]